MKLIWKLLRRHISIGQLVGFFLANLLGMLIVLLSLQFYEDVLPAFSGEDGVMKNTYMIVSKRIAAVSSINGEAQPFTEADVKELEGQGFVRRVGAFTASRYQVYASLSMGGIGMGTDMFFESVPDAFVDHRWPMVSEGEVPIILPRSYLALYNFGFAQTKNLPKLSEGIISMIQMDIRLRGEGGAERHLKGRVVAFSTRLNTVLVPESFMRRSNAELAPNAVSEPTRLIVEVKNPADDAIATFLQQKGYELEDNSLEAGRITYFLKVVAAIVMAVGLLISALSFYILMLSIYLLVQKNAEKLQNLLLIGYSPARVSRPYQLLTIAMNALVLLLAFVFLFFIRGWYLNLLWQMFPAMSEGSTSMTILMGVALFVIVTFFNIVAIRGKINSLTPRRKKLTGGLYHSING
ncbi:MAG: ABC transporter permease [Bacteroidaceae bacterium]|nr:ABC transporter permease [Bacteroidaceae bacterium]